jgi:hypothetical protein
MSICSVRPVVLAASVAWALLPLSAPAAPAPAPKDEAPANTAERARQGLDCAVTLRIDRQPLSTAIAMLREKTKLNLLLDTQAVQSVGINPDQPPTPVDVDLKEVKARAALRTVVAPYGLTFVVVGDMVIITTEDMAAARQMGQHVSVSFDKVELAVALRQIARETGVNLALDPRAEKESSAKVSLQVEDMPLETAVRLLAEMAGLKPVRAGNALFVTRKEVAAELRGDPELNPPAPQVYMNADRDLIINARLWQLQTRAIVPPPPPPPAAAAQPANPADGNPPKDAGPEKEGDNNAQKDPGPGKQGDK